MKLNHQIHNLTLYKDINDFLEAYSLRLIDELGERIIGIYLTGSLSYGDFNINRSDIDITNIISRKLVDDEIQLIKEFHTNLENDFPKWSQRMECTYTPIKMLANTMPPAEPRPWYYGNEKKLYEEAPYGNEWIINKYLLYKHAIPLMGTDFKNLTNKVDIKEVQKACIRDVTSEWKPKLNDDEYFKDSHRASYFVLNLCRILYTLLNKQTRTKKESSNWIKNEFNEWKYIIELVQNWEYGKEMNKQKLIRDFANFVFNKIEETDLYNDLQKLKKL